MKLDSQVSSQLEMSRSVHDFAGLNRLREAAHEGGKEALKEAARQFEAIFVQMLMKSMRKAQDAIADQDSPFNSEQVKFYRDMHDQQLATDLSTKGSLGLADIIVQQLSPDTNYKPAATVRADGKLHQALRNLSHLMPSNEPATGLASNTKRAAFNSPQAFVQELLPQVEAAAQRLGIEAKALVAQAALETGWGQYVMHSGDGKSAHNLFGIKADKRWQGDKVAIDTLEFVGGTPQKQQASFRRYGDFAESLHDYVDFIQQNPRYQKALQHTHEPAAYFKELQQAGYASDPQYAEKIMSIYSGSLLNELMP